MNWVSAFPIGTRAQLVRDTLQSAGITVEDSAEDDDFSFEDRGYHYTAGVTDHVVSELFAWREGVPHAEALELARTVCTPRVIHLWAADDRIELTAHDGPSEVQLQQRPDGTFWIRFDRRAQGRTAVAIDASAMEREVRAIADRLRDAPHVGGDRGRCLDRWRALAGTYVPRVLRPLALARELAPSAQVTAYAWDHLVELDDWLAHHAERFPRDDDWQDVLVVGAGNELAPAWYGWTGEAALEVIGHETRSVALWRGPFAAGVHRLRLPDLELYIPDTLDPSRVTVEDAGPREVIATAGDTRVHLRGHRRAQRSNEVAPSELARLLAAARARR